jgi:hypothetical protein
MLKSLRRKLTLHRRPELDPRWQAQQGHPDALPLREGLFWLIAPLVYLKRDAWERAKPRVADQLWCNLPAAKDDLRALASYSYGGIQRIAREGIRSIAGRLGDQQQNISQPDRELALDVLAAFACDQSWEMRMTVVESLPLLLAVPSLHESALEITAAQVADESYYVAEKALAVLASVDDAADRLARLLRDGPTSAQSMALPAVRMLAKERPDAITDELIDATANLLKNEEGNLSYLATKTFLELTESLPDKAAQVRGALSADLQILFPKFMDQFTDERFTRSTIAKQVAVLCRLVAPAIELVVAALEDSKPQVREGAARTLCALGPLTAEGKGALDERLGKESNWPALVWAAAAWEAVTDVALPVERWPVIPPIWQMVFFEVENEDALPVGVRIEPTTPLTGLLKLEQGIHYLYWPHDHGEMSSERLLDNYMPLKLENLSDEKANGLIGIEVDITGSYRNHAVSVETLERRAGRSPG